MRTIGGIYTCADGSGSRYARLYFRDGEPKQVYGYSVQEGTGAPREIIPESGDAFTVLEQWMDLLPGGAAEFATQEGNTVVFEDVAMAWEELDAPAGKYVVGFIVEDVDGNAYPVYTELRAAE